MIKKIIISRGFTLVELMIATTIFSMVLLISTYTFMRINRLFAKGVTITRTQDVTRNLISDISNQIQLVQGTINVTTGASGYYCINNKRYNFSLYSSSNLYENGSGNVLNSQEITTASCGSPPSSSKIVLLPKNSRLLKFDIQQTASGSGVYNIKMIVFNAPIDMAAGPTNGYSELVQTNPSVDNWQCKGTAGGVYCIITSINTTVTRRNLVDK